jgi:hypothetical protein
MAGSARFYPIPGPDNSIVSHSADTGKGKLTEHLTRDEAGDYFEPNSPNGNVPPHEDSAPQYTYGALFDAPDLSTLIKGRRSPGAREYETKVKSALKSAAIGSLRNGQVADSAAIFRYGPGLAAATGDMCAVNDRAKKAVDLLTAPENPYFAFAFVAVPLIAQLFRNHEQQLEKVPLARKQAREQRKLRRQADDNRRIATIHVPFMRRELKIRVGLRVNPLKGFRQGMHASSQAPEQLIQIVFSDARLQEALEKQGITVVQTNM